MIKIIILFIPVFISCSLNKGNSNQTADNELVLKRTACMGPCPVYEFSVNRDAAELIVTENFSLESGRYTTEIADSTWQNINAIITNEKLWDGKKEHGPMNLKDLPTTYLIVANNDKTKQIKIYGKIPDSLSPHIEQLDQVITNLPWKKQE